MDEAVFKRIPPHNDEAERAVIGSMMMDQDAVQIASEQLQGEDFYNGQYGVIFSALVEMHQRELEPILSPYRISCVKWRFHRSLQV